MVIGTLATTSQTGSTVYDSGSTCTYIELNGDDLIADYEGVYIAVIARNKIASIRKGWAKKIKLLKEKVKRNNMQLRNIPLSGMGWA